MNKPFTFFQLILSLGIFSYTFFTFGWIASYLMLEDNWSEMLIFSKDAMTPRDISDLDKLIYGFQHAPLAVTILMIVSFLYALCLIVLILRRILLTKYQPTN
ncbi:DUF4306 domain-containing protein [Rossellomorea marisflavi]|uniref:DUF4306 domain-containing protein n=1 Tax=Rossellomorea marisflavi TaxID=189381 RepID=UPI00064E224E|nr:DUF4306 domain-containing protein [Rossellomorea marisflavi]KMK93977.1 hypothetical protein VL03_14185 [Rossellomorea marisflavi]QHA37140.1 DUF4306 domain-containing protein [Rossellomorea marisflavi]